MIFTALPFRPTLSRRHIHRQAIARHLGYASYRPTGTVGLRLGLRPCVVQGRQCRPIASMTSKAVNSLVERLEAKFVSEWSGTMPMHHLRIGNVAVKLTRSA